MNYLCSLGLLALYGLKAFGRDISNIVLVNKLLQSLPHSLEPKVTAILMAKDLNKLEIDQFIGSLITHEMINSNDDKNKKKDLALKAFPDDKKINDEDISLLSENLNGFLSKGEKVGKDS